MNIPEFKSYRFTAGELQDFLNSFSSENGCGFYRMSDGENAVILKDCPFPPIPFSANSFLYEAVFYIEGKYSLGIREYNDFWLVTRVDWNILPPESSAGKDEFRVTTQFLPDGTQLRFYTQFLPEKCCNFATLRPAWTAFTGFVKGE